VRARVLDQPEGAIGGLRSERVEVHADARRARGFRNLRDQAGVECQRWRFDRDIGVQARALDGSHGCQIHVGHVPGDVVLRIPKAKRGGRHAPRRECLRQAQRVRQLGTRHIAPRRLPEQRLPGRGNHA
jgi:hypothetical protein